MTNILNGFFADSKEEEAPETKKEKEKTVRSDTRKVIHAINYTLQHRRYYYGVGCDRPYNLVESADKVGVYKKKTLDDYFIQLQMAYLSGMSFDHPFEIDMG